MGESQENTEHLQVRKKIVPGAIDVHPTEDAIVVNYTVQAAILEHGQQVADDRKNSQKIIRVKTLHENSNISRLAQEVIEKCKLIHASRYAEVEQILYYLLQRQLTQKPSGSVESDRAWLHNKLNSSRKSDDTERDGVDLQSVQDEPSCMSNIEEYIEGLYEDIPEKVKSTRSILQLAKVPENMAKLISNESLISALSRVLREDGRKSMELVTNIIYVFFCFTNYSEFHSVVTANKLGDMCLRLTDQELTRFDLWVQDIRNLETQVLQAPNDKSLISQLDQSHKKFQNMLRKQDQLLFVSFHLLMNLAEDPSIEVKMVKRDIVKYLINMLDRKAPELLILTVTFIKKLSVIRENVDELFKHADELLDKLGRLIDTECDGLHGVSMRLLLNLSHSANFRTILVREGFHHKLRNIIKNGTPSTVTLQLMYQLSIDDKSRASTVFTDCIPTIIQMILEYKGDRVNVEVMALAINISTILGNAQIICQDNGIKFLIKRAIKTKDPLLFKMLRNISQHSNEGIKMMFLDHIDDMMHLMLDSLSNADVLIEILGILGNLTIAEFDFGKLAIAYDLLYVIKKIIYAAVSSSNIDSRRIGSTTAVSRNSAIDYNKIGSKNKLEGVAEDDDILLQTIILLSTMSLDENISPMVASANLLPLLIDVMIAKEEDDEIILQVCYCIYQFLLHDSTRTILVGKTDVVGYLIDLLYDRNIEIRKMCDASLSIIGEIDEDWNRKLRQQKFAWHNSEWISMMTEVPEPPNHTLSDQSSLFSKNSHADMSLSNTMGYRGALTLGMYDDESDDEESPHNGIGGSSALLDGPGLY
ncbi:hypothetical protein BASA50_008371 [Batrachochytrium salamandrivorans]|uniref:Kinesin-associated protein 3 n=1 Tax=Batrachochytrium salamandrivorans TaxID=1357716 RepID=A0ABQ8F4U6_9FUNG|nr:hypothetical protein BASA50_008371 [Batrachochytrium salamandrivorans]